jgi:hypothetical protein
MHLAYLFVIILTAAANIYAATCDFTRPAWILANMKKVGVPERWLPTLGILKALGGIGLLAGIAIPGIGLAAAACLVLFFVGAMVTTTRARYYGHLPVPLLWLVLAAASLALFVRSA